MHVSQLVRSVLLFCFHSFEFFNLLLQHFVHRRSYAIDIEAGSLFLFFGKKLHFRRKAICKHKNTAHKYFHAGSDHHEVISIALNFSPFAKSNLTRARVSSNANQIIFLNSSLRAFLIFQWTNARALALQISHLTRHILYMQSDCLFLPIVRVI